jgi:hypothetical protein
MRNPSELLFQKSLPHFSFKNSFNRYLAYAIQPIPD